MRYIDADKTLAFISRILGGLPLVLLNECEKNGIDIVRCKECRHWIGETEHYEDREYKACWQLCGQYMDSEFWCKYGERKEGE